MKIQSEMHINKSEMDMNKSEMNINVNIQNVTIIGLGLIGGSIAKALKNKAGIKNIVGIDSDEAVIKQALEEGIISVGLTDFISEKDKIEQIGQKEQSDQMCRVGDNEQNEHMEKISQENQVKQSDIIFICTPVGKITSIISKILPLINENCLITDVGSTKSQLINEIDTMSQKFHFVGGHPMAGSEKSGYSAGSDHLFENAYYIITPCSKSSDNDIKALTNVATALGGIPVVLDSELHDKVTGTISHVPHIISAALVKLVQEADSSEHHMQRLAAGGFKDITRISSSSPEMWHNICFSNREAITQIIDDYIELLNNFKSYLFSNNDHEVYSFFKDAKEYRDTFTSRITGLIPYSYELIIDVADRPGIIGEVATILGNSAINIKNINITNSREFEGGVLILTLPDSASVQNAEKILSENNYKIINRK